MKISQKRTHRRNRLVGALWLLLAFGFAATVTATPARADGTETHGVGH